PAPVVRTGDAADEQCHDLVANELVDDCVVGDEYARDRPIEAIHQLGEVGRVGALTQSGRPTYIREQDGDVDLRAAGRQLLAARRAEVRVLARPALSDNSKQAPSDA